MNVFWSGLRRSRGCTGIEFLCGKGCGKGRTPGIRLVDWTEICVAATSRFRSSSRLSQEKSFGRHKPWVRWFSYTPFGGLAILPGSLEGFEDCWYPLHGTIPIGEEYTCPEQFLFLSARGTSMTGKDLAFLPFALDIYFLYFPWWLFKGNRPRLVMFSILRPGDLGKWRSKSRFA